MKFFYNQISIFQVELFESGDVGSFSLWSVTKWKWGKKIF